MSADKDIEELVIEPIRVIHNLLNLQARLKIKVVADMTSLKIEIDETDFALTRRLVRLELYGRLECKRGVADATGARNERNRDRLRAICVTGILQIVASATPRKDFENLLGVGVHRNPLGIAAAQQRLVIARRKLVTDQNEEHLASIARHRVRELGERAQISGGRNYQHKSQVIDGSARKI